MQTEWNWKIEAKTRWFHWNLKELWQYKDLLNRFVRRDLIANYQQTVLGPFWIFLQPVLTTIVYWVIFGKVAGISTDGIPPVLFYLPGVIVWAYFSDCLNGTMYTFLQNSALFSKVYFPRLIIPLSAIFSHTVRMLVQLLLFTSLYLFYLIFTNAVHPNLYILLLPFFLLLTAAFSLGAGLIISVMTARYRDLDYALQFLLRLFMFASPVVYPTSIVPDKYRFIFWLNPLTPIIESFRTAFFTTGPLHYKYLLLTLFSITALLTTGLTLFKKRELNVMDIV
ncbi:lipopolysaccharide transport system permease protein [Chitinophaga sp. CF118]|uniref:ABC transporter permease n=1 Tax=Chitinophaga sp. CF118 TaxID=1884367 RepID=UPI0008E38C9A|nr:ABC transporter permease [Chitinophaga sp. CF118]SFE51157.1 lipopolysaccharide transport system permease protein [Chitinophaga sp. CF118]